MQLTDTPAFRAYYAARGEKGGRGLGPSNGSASEADLISSSYEHPGDDGKKRQIVNQLIPGNRRPLGNGYNPRPPAQHTSQLQLARAIIHAATSETRELRSAQQLAMSFLQTRKAEIDSLPPTNRLALYQSILEPSQGGSDFGGHPLVGRFFTHGNTVYRIHKVGLSAGGFAMGWYHDVSKFPYFPPKEVAEDTSYSGIEDSLLLELERRCRRSSMRWGQQKYFDQMQMPAQVKKSQGPAAIETESMRGRRRTGVAKPKTCQYRGVSWHNSKWKAQISVGGHMHFLGYFSTQENAACAFDRAAVAYRGSKAALNFPEGREMSCPHPDGAVASKDPCQLLDERIAAIEVRLQKRNRQKRTSLYRGVSAQGGKWKAQISIQGRMHFLGNFKDEKQAALAFDKAAQIYRGENTALNFPAHPSFLPQMGNGTADQSKLTGARMSRFLPSSHGEVNVPRGMMSTTKSNLDAFSGSKGADGRGVVGRPADEGVAAGRAAIERAVIERAAIERAAAGQAGNERTAIERGVSESKPDLNGSFVVKSKNNVESYPPKRPRHAYENFLPKKSARVDGHSFPSQRPNPDDERFQANSLKADDENYVAKRPKLDSAGQG